MALIQSKQINISGGGFPKALTGNQDMSASVTAADGDQATVTTVAVANYNGGGMSLTVNGTRYDIGDGSKLKAAYISGDAGATARAWSAVVAGDTIRWNGSVAGFQLAVTDRIDLVGLTL